MSKKNSFFTHFLSQKPGKQVIIILKVFIILAYLGVGAVFIFYPPMQTIIHKYWLRIVIGSLIIIYAGFRFYRLRQEYQ